MIDELVKEKAQLRAAGHRAARDVYFEGGPYLEGDDIVVPSPQLHPQMKTTLTSRGFRYVNDGDCPYPHYRRSVLNPIFGKVYTPQQWLEWTRARYAWAWPWYGVPGEVWDAKKQIWRECRIIEDSESFINQATGIVQQTHALVWDGERAARVAPQSVRRNGK